MISCIENNRTQLIAMLLSQSLSVNGPQSPFTPSIKHDTSLVYISVNDTIHTKCQMLTVKRHCDS